MEALEILLSRGAQSVGGDLILRNKAVGKSRNGVFTLTADGEAELEIEEVVAKPVKTEKPKAAKAVKADAVDTLASDVDALLG